jgi:hypothetical protein
MISLEIKMGTGALTAMAFLILALVSNASAQNCEPRILDSMENATDWNTFTDGEIGSSITLNSIPGSKNFAIEMAFDIEKDGWIGISKSIDPETLSGTKEIQFTYKGSGVRNNLQLKLIDTDGTNFGVVWNGATAVDEWATIQVPYENLRCLWCKEMKSLNLDNVEKIEFAVSNDGRPTGEGNVIIDDVLGIIC